MKIEIETSPEKFKDLILAIEANAELADVKHQIQTALALAGHHQIDDIPKEGDHPIIDRFE